MMPRVDEKCVESTNALLNCIYVGEQALERERLCLGELIDSLRFPDPRTQALVQPSRLFGPGHDYDSGHVQVFKQGAYQEWS